MKASYRELSESETLEVSGGTLGLLAAALCCVTNTVGSTVNTVAAPVVEDVVAPATQPVSQVMTIVYDTAGNVVSSTIG
ncbi:hypothetical protein [Rouxiella chamberiensis]|uniref:Uncharacterized protein n=1 Tax=Rouxiella chamberiensis TaxID=1513468 RepID=A0ABY7HT49_9GAMM|nr:hypothetical protein [Rouxiella chamberiensis]WAT02571.1 hypothetical protein O1V66_08445 [Rouxiella chamberiensis]